jgi:hypothetical protein
MVRACVSQVLAIEAMTSCIMTPLEGGHGMFDLLFVDMVQC